MIQSGNIHIVPGEVFQFKDIYESDNLCLAGGTERLSNNTCWNLCFAPNTDIEKISGTRGPQYLIFFAWYPDNTMDVIRFDIKEPKYLTGYNETRKFYKDELEWVIHRLSNKNWKNDQHTGWDYVIQNYNSMVLDCVDEIKETWNMPNYSLLETED